MSRPSTPRTRRPGLGTPVVVALTVVAVVAVGGLVAWAAGAFDTGEDDPEASPSGSTLVVPLGAAVDAVPGVSWPHDDAGQPRAATAIEQPREVEVAAGDQLVLATPSQTILLHQRDGRVTAVDLQPQADAGSAEDAIATLRQLLDDHDLLDAATEQELDDWAASSPDSDPLLGDTPSLRVAGPTASIFAELRPTSQGDWYVAIEVALPVDDDPAATAS